MLLMASVSLRAKLSEQKRFNAKFRTDAATDFAEFNDFLFLFFFPLLPSRVILWLIIFHAALYQCQPALGGV